MNVVNCFIDVFLWNPCTVNFLDNIKICNKSCCICCTKQENQRSIFLLTSLLVEINGKIDNLLTQNPVQNVFKETDVLMNSGIQFPIKTVEEFENFNEFLLNQDNYASMVI